MDNLNLKDINKNMNKKIFLISFIGLLAILLILGYGFYVSKGKKPASPTSTQSKVVLKEKGEFAKDCAFLLANENKEGQKKDYLICGQREVGRTVLLTKEEIPNYLKDNEDLAIAFNPFTFLKSPLKNLRAPVESTVPLSEQTPLCIFIYPDFSSKRTDAWEIQPLEILASLYKAEVNMVLCTKSFNVSDFPSFSLSGRIVKEGQIFEKFKNIPFESILLQINIPRDVKEIPQQSLAGYFLRNPLEFIPIYEISIPLK